MSSILDRAKSVGKSNKPPSSAPKAAHHKHHDPSGNRPTDHLISRGEQWRLITKGVHDFYHAVALSERHAASEIERAANALPIPFVYGGQFDQEEGWQAAFYAVRERARKIAEIHEHLAKEIEGDILTDLNRTKHYVKSHTKGVAAEAGKLADETDAERKASTTALARHGNAIQNAGSTQVNPTAYDDAFITSSVVDRQLHKQLESENRLTKSQIHYQQLAEQVDQRATTEIQAASKIFAEVEQKALAALKEEFEQLEAVMAKVNPAGEWPSYLKVPGAYVDPDTQMRDPALVQYPHNDHDANKTIWEGTLERKKRFAKSYTEVRAVVSASGFLHTYPVKTDPDAPKDALPEVTLYLPNFAVTPLPAESASKHKISLVGKKANKSGAGSTMQKLGLHNREHEHTFRAPTHGQLVGFFNVAEPFTREIHRVQPAKTKKSAVPFTVANVGLPGGAQVPESEAGDDLTADDVDEAVRNAGVDGSVVPAHHVAAEDDAETRGGSSDEEEAEQFTEASATTPGAVNPAASEGEGLPGYAANGASAPAEKKVAFDSEPSEGPSGSVAAGGAPAVGGSSAAEPGSSH